MNLPNKPMMNDIDINLLSSYLSPTDIMLEWGSGVSTLYFSKLVNKYYSIEHDATWANMLYFHLPENVKYNLIKSNLVLTEPWTKYDEIKDYVNYIDKLNVAYFDKIFIDGRGRSFCALKALNYINNDSLVFIHDFWTRECRGYFEVFKYYDIVDYTTTDESLIVLKKKLI